MSSDDGAKALIDITSGTVAGAAQILVGHPFDTTKVTMQSSAQRLTPVGAVKQILASQGPRGLYRGIGPPMATIAAFNALLFGVTGSLNRLVRPDGGPLTAAEAAFTGGLAGIPVSLLATPTELLKCRLQAQGGARPPPGAVYTCADAQAGKVLYSNSLDALTLILKFEGVRGMFKGLTATLIREVPGNALYFGAYAWAKETLAAAKGIEPSQLGVGSLMAAGGLAGAAFWAPVYPVDIVKTRIQVDSSFNPKYRGLADCFQQTVKQQGWRGLFRGFEPCIVRSVPANAVTFIVYEAMHNFLTR